MLKRLLIVAVALVAFYLPPQENPFIDWRVNWGGNPCNWSWVKVCGW